MRKYYYILLVFLLFSCNENHVPKPERFLDEKTMTDILYDAAVYQAAQGFNSDKLTEKNISASSYIYVKYSIDSTVYYQNQRYYASDILRYKAMYETVTKRLKETQEKLPKEQVNKE